MLSIFAVPKSDNKNVGKTTVAPGQFLERANTWNDQIQIYIDNKEMDLALDVYRLRICCELTKEQGDHTIAALTDVQDVWNHQERLYGDSEGMSIVRDTVQLLLNVENGVQPSRVAIERGERVVPDTDVTEKELDIRRRLRDVLRQAANADTERINLDRRGTEPPRRQYVWGQKVLLFTGTEDGMQQVHPDEEERFVALKWVPQVPGTEYDVGVYVIFDQVDNKLRTSAAELMPCTCRSFSRQQGME